jgi:catechol 2,3-dioxygenase-like lactoylglutathione lyase family enzyme
MSDPLSGRAIPFGIYEVAIRVKDLAKAHDFYREILGLDDGLLVEERGMYFLRTPGDQGMVVLIQDDDDFPSQHYAFSIDESDVERTLDALRAAGVEAKDPVFHDWMPGTSIYFSDPDGHDLEFFAPRAAAKH